MQIAPQLEIGGRIEGGQKSSVEKYGAARCEVSTLTFEKRWESFHEH